MGIIGGSGLDDPEFLDDRREIYRETPYGMCLCDLRGTKRKKKNLFEVSCTFFCYLRLVLLLFDRL